tara:strand:- start:757 stop:987 length:231 start_codon:yes stop_codon:yes gene_type:complete
MWTLLPDSVRRAVVWLAAGFIAVISIFAAGKRTAREQAVADRAEEYARTRKDMDNAVETIGDDPAVLRDWLRDRGK